MELGASVTVLGLLEPLGQAILPLLVRLIGCILQHCKKASKIPVFGEGKGV